LDQPIKAVIIDIDTFEPFNDTYGHVEDNNCLKRVSQILKERVHRPSDIVCRLGGKDFIYILGNTDISQASKLCEKIHFLMSGLNSSHKTPNNCLTVSIGLASSP
jgi:diguanylate cyclase (GGDEF)-like protein